MNSVVQTSPFTVSITESCPQPNTLTASVLVDQEYSITDAALTYTFDPFTADPVTCGIIYTYTVPDPAGDPVIVAFDGATRTFMFDYSADLAPLVDPLAQFKDYTITVTGTAGLVSPSSVT